MRRKPEMQVLILILFGVWYLGFGTPTAFAVVDPLSSPNNKFGIHILSATPDEASPAAQLVNSNGGDWGYITILIESGDRNHDKWQTFFNDLRRRHLIPIVRIATQPEGNFWKVPYEGEEIAWADFLDNLVWPTKNRYIVIYNEPNQGQEWAGQVDPVSYAKVLDKTITALKNKNPDFFVLNGGFDASAPQKPPLYEDEISFMQQMDQAVPGIFNRLDGWVSHSYPNPGFVGSPDGFGRKTVRTWVWELALLRSFGVSKTLPVFITETGWKHAEGVDFDKSLPTSEQVGIYLQTAFQNAWNSNQIVAVTPFLLNYQESPFDHFSFKRMTGTSQDIKILGAANPQFYPHYQAMVDLRKAVGKPVQDNKAQLIKGTIYPSLVNRQSYTIPLTFKNTGQSVWGEEVPVELLPVEGQKGLGVTITQPPTDRKVEPGQETVFYLHLKPAKSGAIKLKLQLQNGNKPFDQPPLDFTINVKPAVILQTSASLTWKNNPSGDYLLYAQSDALSSAVPVKLSPSGQSDMMEANYLLPDYEFKFTLQRSFYKPKTISVKLVSGVNRLDFGSLEPDFISALLEPVAFWRLLPFSN